MLYTCSNYSGGEGEEKTMGQKTDWTDQVTF